MTQRIPLANGRGFALVDDGDVPLVSGYSWHLCRRLHTNYAQAYVRGSGRGGNNSTYMHILIMGECRVDHVSGDGLDNRRANLRLATVAQNLANMRPRGGTSRFKGVFWAKHARRWRASIQIGGRAIHLGYFADEADAARAYDEAALAAWGEYARPNRPPAG